jgi:hypothetical protein
MRIQSLLTLGLLLATWAAAEDAAPVSNVSMWIWSDKYVYQPGQNLTLRWTVKTNGDSSPYTVFVYRQNNQTGKKTYLPGGGEDPTDINGTTLTQGFQGAPLSDTTKAVLIGDGGQFPALALPNELGMHTQSSSFATALARAY